MTNAGKRSTNDFRARLHELLEYNGETGVLSWRVARSAGVKSGDRAGSLTKGGYRTVRVEGRPYQEHRIIFLMVHGYMPKCIDHKNRNPSDNRIVNLRESTLTQNQINKAGSGKHLKGIWQVKDRWRAALRVNKKQKNLGTFDTQEEAHAAYMAAAILHYGDFARTT